MLITGRNLDSSPSFAKVDERKVVSHFATLVAAVVSVPQTQLAYII